MIDTGDIDGERLHSDIVTENMEPEDTVNIVDDFVIGGEEVPETNTNDLTVGGNHSHVPRSPKIRL